MPDISVTDLQAATAALNAAAAQLRGDHKAMSDWSTTQADTVTVKDEAGQDVLVPSLHYLLTQFSILETDVRALIGDLYARPIAEFYAERQRNLAQFAASGFVEMGLHQDNGSSLAHVNEGMYAYTDAANLLFLGRAAGASALGDSRTPYPMTVVAGLVSKLMDLNTDAVSPSQACIKFPAAPDGKTTYNRSTGEVVTHSSEDAAFDAAAINSDVEVVTERVDLYGLEAYLEAVTVANPHVYPHGLIQSKASSMEGVATGASTRPDSYYAVFAGDTSSRGKGVDLFACTPAQQAAILANPAHHIYRLADGTLVQWRLRQRTVAGAGNGDWGVIQSAATAGHHLKYSAQVIVHPQGSRDSVSVTGGLFPAYTLPASPQSGPHRAAGVFDAVSGVGVADAGAAVAGQCYFLVLGTVPRLNQGCYHPSLNPLGTAAVAYNYGGVVKFNAWHGIGNALTSQRQCFAGPFFYNEAFTAPGRYDDTGSLSSASSMASGRPDGRFHDAIYPGGYGGVVDLRLEARRQLQADHDRVDAMVKAGEYRGLETVKRMAFVNALDTDGSQSSGIWFNGLPEGKAFSDIVAGSWVGGIRADGTGYRVGRIKEVKGDYLVMEDSVVRSSDRYLVMFEENLSVSGEFTWQTVIGNPANIAQCADLAGGWPGDWCPVIPDATTKVYPFGRKLISTGSLTYTSDNGASWNSITGHGVGWNESTNSKTVASGPNDVGIHTYTAWANMTEPCANALLRDGEAGISGTVFQQMRSAPTAGALLTASLIGKVPTDNGSGYTYGNLSYLGGSVFLGKLYPSRMPHRHEPVSLRKPLNSSPASKSLRYSHVDAGLVTNCYAYAELRFDPDYDSANDFGSLIQPDHSQAWNAGQKYRIQTDDGVICVVCVNSHNGAQFQNFTQLPTGEWSISTGVVYFRPWYGPAAGWGDSGEMPIVDNNGTWLDDNGHTLRAGTHKLALPFGWA